MESDRKTELRRLVAVAADSADEDEREAALAELRDRAQRRFGFPGQRRRGEPPAGVAVRA